MSTEPDQTPEPDAYTPPAVESVEHIDDPLVAVESQPK